MFITVIFFFNPRLTILIHLHLVYLQKKTYQCIKCQMVFYSEWDIQVHVANHMLGRKKFFVSFTMV